MVSTGAALHYKDPVILTSKDPVKEAKTKNLQERRVHARRSAVIASIALNKEKKHICLSHTDRVSDLVCS